jgi:hypothetical protein
MWKTAYQKGVKLALDENPLAAQQLAAAQKLYGIGGGLLGATGGGLLGHYLGKQIAESADVDPETARWIGAGLGALVGGTLGHGAGSSAATLSHTAPAPEPPAPEPEPEPEAQPLASFAPDYAFDPGLGLVDYLPQQDMGMGGMGMSGMGMGDMGMGMGLQPAYEPLPEYPTIGMEPEYGMSPLAFEPGWY